MRKYNNKVIAVIVCLILVVAAGGIYKVYDNQRKEGQTKKQTEVAGTDGKKDTNDKENTEDTEKVKTDTTPEVAYVDAFSVELSAESTVEAEKKEFELDKAEKIATDSIVMERMKDSFVISGSFEKISDDAAVVLVDEEGKVKSFKMNKTESSVQAVESDTEELSEEASTKKESFGVKIDESMVEQGHSYFIYLYNDGKLLYTDKKTTFLINTRQSDQNVGSQYALYQLGERNYNLVDKSKSIESSVASEQSKPEMTAEIDKQITEELENNNYTIDEPLVIQNPFQTSPLSAMILFKTEEECKVKVNVKGKTKETDISSVIEAATNHRIPVAGLYAGTENTVVLELIDDKGKTTKKKKVKITTDALPETLKGVVTTDQAAKDSAIGLMMISGLRAPYLYAFDSAGDIRWYYTEETMYYGAFPLSNGNFLVEAPEVLFPNASMPNSPEFYEMDYLGRVYNVYFFPEGQHHEIKEKEPGGNLLVATNSNNGYEQDMIQEIDRKTGEVVKSLDITKMFEGLKYISNDDWAHINTVSYDKKTDSILISVRNLSSGIRINWSTDEIEWILADPSIWEGTGYEDKVLKPVGDVDYHYEQHTVYEVEDLDDNPDTVNVMLFDNHHAKHNEVSTFDKVKKSYVKSYIIDAKNMTVKQDHKYETELSAITSNFLLDTKHNSVFSVCAYLKKPTDGGALGAVYEFDKDTEEVKGRYLISHRYYRGYNIKLDLNQYAKEYELSDNYYIGQLHAPAKVDQVKEVETQKKWPENVTVTLTDDIMYLYAPDHSITEVIFSGEKGTFVYDISDIKQMHENKHTYRYKLPIPLNGLDEDTYQVKVIYKDRMCKMDDTITVKNH